jgi:hypothetical protein
MTMAEVRAKGFTINSGNFSIGRLTRRPFDRSLEADTLISIDPVQVVGTRRAIGSWRVIAVRSQTRCWRAKNDKQGARIYAPLGITCARALVTPGLGVAQTSSIPQVKVEEQAPVLRARIVAVGIPQASAVAEIGTFHPGGPIHDVPGFAEYTKSGNILDPKLAAQV